MFVHKQDRQADKQEIQKKKVMVVVVVVVVLVGKAKNTFLFEFTGIQTVLWDYAGLCQCQNITKPAINSGLFLVVLWKYFLICLLLIQ